MQKLLWCGTVIAATLLLPASGARAHGDAPWCMNMPLGGGSVAERCDFRTFEACSADRILSNAFCVQNSRYLPYWQGHGFDEPHKVVRKKLHRR
jgi:hypothetical protein